MNAKTTRYVLLLLLTIVCVTSFIIYKIYALRHVSQAQLEKFRPLCNKKIIFYDDGAGEFPEELKRDSDPDIERYINSTCGVKELIEMFTAPIKTKSIVDGDNEPLSLGFLCQSILLWNLDSDAHTKISTGFGDDGMGAWVKSRYYFEPNATVFKKRYVQKNWLKLYEKYGEGLANKGGCSCHVSLTGGHLNCDEIMQLYKELGETAFSQLSFSQTESVLAQLLTDVKMYKKGAVDKYFLVRAFIRDEAMAEMVEDVDVALLHALGDEQYLRALKKQSRAIQDSAASSLLRYQWNVDDNDRFVQAKNAEENEYPKTKDYVFSVLSD